MRRQIKTYALLGLASLVVLLAVWSVRESLEEWRAPANALWDRISVGDPESLVLRILGEPLIEYQKNTAPPDYYLAGYGRKERPITGEVLIYCKSDMVLYVWLDEIGRVEDMFRGVS